MFYTFKIMYPFNWRNITVSGNVLYVLQAITCIIIYTNPPMNLQLLRARNHHLHKRYCGSFKQQIFNKAQTVKIKSTIASTKLSCHPFNRHIASFLINSELTLLKLKGAQRCGDYFEQIEQPHPYMNILSFGQYKHYHKCRIVIFMEKAHSTAIGMFFPLPLWLHAPLISHTNSVIESLFLQTQRV